MSKSGGTNTLVSPSPLCYALECFVAGEKVESVNVNARDLYYQYLEVI